MSTFNANARNIAVTATCFAASVSVLQLISLPWLSVVVFILWTILATCVARIRGGPAVLLQWVVPIALYLLSIYSLPQLTATIAAGCCYMLSIWAEKTDRLILRHFAGVILLFLVVDWLILEHGLFIQWLTNITHSYTALIRAATTTTEIVGPWQVHHRFLVFTLVAIVPIEGKAWYVLLLPIVYVFVVVLLIPCIVFGFDILGLALLSAVSCFLVLEVTRNTHSNVERGNLDIRWVTGLALLRTVTLLILLVSVTQGRINIWPTGSSSVTSLASTVNDTPMHDRSILFVNDYCTREGDDKDITHFAATHIATVSDFDEARNNPRYDKLAYKFLPALGYTVAVKSIDDLTSSDFGQHQLVVLICLQKRLSPEIKRSLYKCIEYGTTNLLIVGDHTDIQQVQMPFNDIMEPLGVTLNYDSLIPSGQWQSHVKYTVHPINGHRSMLSIQAVPDPGVSVGASLTINELAACPLLVSVDGYADEGTPDAPSIAGLGDMSYTKNEVRGGLVLAAERPLGQGTILAFGDTAHLQNSSIADNYAYLASMFDYLTQHRRQTIQGNTFHILGLICGILLFISLIWRFSHTFCVLCIVLFPAAVLMCSTLNCDSTVLESLRTDVLLIDDGHAEVFEREGGNNDTRTLLDLLDYATPNLALRGKAFSSIAHEHTKCIVLLAPRGKIGVRNEEQLRAFVNRGGRLLYASGFYESTEHQHWLEHFGCRITPIALGAGQHTNVPVARYGDPLRLVEAWGIEVSNDWKKLAEGFGTPIVAMRDVGDGRVCVVADSYALLDGTMSNDRLANADSYYFVARLIEELTAPSSSLP